MNKAENLHWGISTLGCPELNLPQVMALAEKFGVEYLEIRTLNGSKNAYETLYLPENLPVMRQIAVEKRCRVLDTSFRLTVNTPEDRDELLKYARCADDFNIPYLRIFGGGKAGETLLPEHIRHALETLDWFEKQHFDTALALETHDICSNSKYCQEIAGHYGKFLPVIWDIHHTWQVAGEPLRETFAGLQKQIVAVHFKSFTMADPCRASGNRSVAVFL
jgi:sugar phosphate isomerase/epimerase